MSASLQTIEIKKLLKSLISLNASDLHLVTQSKPQIRVNGKLTSLDLPILNGLMIKQICYSLLNEKQKKIFEKDNEIDFAFTIDNVSRFRANFYRTLNDMAAAFRTIATTISSLDELKTPNIFKQIIKREKGLILLTGPTGSGKSTTLAAMLNEINERQHAHIITIEDPVEFIHTNKQSLFSHREVGLDTNSFSKALKASLREDPDIIFIGEMRDKQTIQAALTAAETGHLVFTTLHTNSAALTINRIIDVFSSAKQAQIRAQLSMNLVACISQSLLPKIGGGRIAIYEILISNPAISNLIREDKIHQIYSQMQLNQNSTFMTTQTQELIKNIKDQKISKEDALKASNNQQELMQTIQRVHL